MILKSVQITINTHVLFIMQLYRYKRGGEPNHPRARSRAQQGFVLALGTGYSLTTYFIALTTSHLCRLLSRFGTDGGRQI